MSKNREIIENNEHLKVIIENCGQDETMNFHLVILPPHVQFQMHNNNKKYLKTEKIEIKLSSKPR